MRVAGLKATQNGGQRGLVDLSSIHAGAIFEETRVFLGYRISLKAQKREVSDLCAHREPINLRGGFLKAAGVLG